MPLSFSSSRSVLDSDMIDQLKNVGLSRPADPRLSQAHARPIDISPEVASTSTTATLPPTSTTHPASGIAVPTKRPTDMHDVRSLSSPPPSPSTQPQPAKRRHATTSAPSRSPAARDSEFGADLDPFFIEHDTAAQRLLDEVPLAWGTVYEIARGISKGHWTWSAVTKEKLDKLRGNNADAAPRVAAVMQGREAPRFAAAELWCGFRQLRPMR